MIFERGEIGDFKDYIITGDLVVTKLSFYFKNIPEHGVQEVPYTVEGSKISIPYGAPHGIVFIVETTSGTFEVEAPNDGFGEL